MKKRFKVIDFYGDVGLEVRGESMEELFENAAKGLSMLITTSKIKPVIKIEISLTATDKETLLLKWLNELIFYFDAKGFVGSKVVFKKFDQNNLVASVCGDYFDNNKHKAGLLIKAATYHNMLFDTNEKGLYAKIIFDI